MLLKPPTFSLAMQLARYENLGIPFEEVLRRCTVQPVRHLGLADGQGTMVEGGVAVLAVFRRHETEAVFGDRPNGNPEQAIRRGHVVYEPVMTVKDGMVVYRNILL